MTPEAIRLEIERLDRLARLHHTYQDLVAVRAGLEGKPVLNVRVSLVFQCIEQSGAGPHASEAYAQFYIADAKAKELLDEALGKAAKDLLDSGGTIEGPK